MKPKLPAIVYVLFVLAGVGLIALGIAAFTAFSQVAGWQQALAASVLIEAAMVIEGIALIRRNWWAAGGVLISLLVSGTYNYIQAEQAGKLHGLTSGWQLFTLAVGPLSALLFLALTIGYEIREHDKRVARWMADQQAAKAETQASAKQEQDRQEEISRLERQKQMEIQAQLDYQKEKLRLEQETEREKARLEEDRKLKVAQARIEARERAKIESANAAQSAQIAQDGRARYEDFAQAMQSNGTHEWTGDAIAQTFEVSRRTGNYWLSRWKREHSEQDASQN